MPDIATFRENAFFIVGAPKCGTTSLAYHLAEHPEVSFSEPKEPHFFSPDYPFGPPELKTLEDYLKCFPEKPQAQRYGEGSVFSLFSAEAVNRIEALTQSQARYIVCLRNPVHASFSLHAQHVAFGWDNESTYLAALDRTEEECSAVSGDSKIASVLGYGKFYRYANHVRRLVDRVGHERVLFNVMERDGQDPDAFYDRLHGFLGVSARKVPHSHRANEARRIGNDAVYRILTNPLTLGLARSARKLLAPNGFGLSRPIRKITSHEKQAAHALFADDIQETAALVGFEPELWQERS